jgi:hypothetical protein
VHFPFLSRLIRRFTHGARRAARLLAVCQLGPAPRCQLTAGRVHGWAVPSGQCCGDLDPTRAEEIKKPRGGTWGWRETARSEAGGRRDNQVAKGVDCSTYAVRLWSLVKHVPQYASTLFS